MDKLRLTPTLNGQQLLAKLVEERKQPAVSRPFKGLFMCLIRM